MREERRSTSVKIGSINCRSLSKLSDIPRRQSFTNFLRHQSLDILTMQETHAAPLDIQKSLNMLLQANSSCWSSHCGIVSLNKNITITPVLSAIDHRFLIGNVSHVHSKFSPFYIMTIYAPAEPIHRRKFFTSLAEFTPLVSIIQSTLCRLLITGDFNYSPLTRHGAPPSWLDFLAYHMHNCMTRPLDTHPTFRRGSSISTIDYIYATPSLHSSVCSPYIDFINDQWTDHALLTVSLKLISDSNGPGLWRMNPNFLQNKRFVDALSRMLEEYASSLPLDITEPHLLWERLKHKIKQLARSFGRRHASWRTQQLRRLQSKRNRILRIFKQNGALNPLLEVVERQIGSLQSEIVRNNILRAGKHWREHGETSAGYLKRTIATRATSRYIPSLKDTPESECTSDCLG